ncbi:hypothetical protein MRX96_016372 [Rhipicephalus microplus]
MVELTVLFCSMKNRGVSFQSVGAGNFTRANPSDYFFRFVDASHYRLAISPVSRPFKMGPKREAEVDEPTTPYGDTLPLQEEDETEPSTSPKVINGSVPFRRVVPCNQRSDCDDVLVCLPSKICGCPELTPVLLQESDGIVCASARRLSESCLSDAECMHGNEHARCLDSSCSCQSRFYVSTDGSLCLPDFVAWSPLRTAVVTAVLLILAFIVLGALGYQRLRRPRSHEAQRLLQPSSSPKSISCSGRVTNVFDGSLDKHDDRIKSPWRWLGSFVSSVTCRLEEVRRRCRWSLSDRSPAWENAPEQTPESQVATQTESCGQSGNAVQPVLSNTTNGTSTRFKSGLSIATRTSRSTASPAVGVTAYPEEREKRRGPVPSPRTRVSTLSTSTLMPCNRAYWRGNYRSCSASSAVVKAKYGGPRGFWGEQHVQLRKSYPRASPLIQIESSSSCCGGHSCPNLHFYGPTVESWSQHVGCSCGSCMKLPTGERDVRKDLKLGSTNSQPTWPYDRVVCKGPDRKARTCEAFAVYGKESLPKEIRKLLVSPLLRREPQNVSMTGNCRSACRESSRSRHLHNEALALNATSNGVLSTATRRFPSPARSLAPTLPSPKRLCGKPESSSESSRSPGHTNLRMPFEFCACQHSTSKPQAAQVAPFSRSSQRLNYEHEFEVRSAALNVSDGSTMSSWATR